MSPSRSGGAVSSSAIRAARSTSAARTVSSSGTGVAGCSWSTEPMRAALGTSMSPLPAESWPRISLNSVDFPAPLRPTRPTLAPTGKVTVAWSKKRRPQASKTRSWMRSMRAVSIRQAGRYAQRRLGGRDGPRYKPASPQIKSSVSAKRMTDRTFSILKPDATARNLTGKINAVIEDAGLRIVAQRRIRMTQAQAEKFYEVHKERPFYGELVEFMTSGAGRRAGPGRRRRRREIPRSHGRHESRRRPPKARSASCSPCPWARTRFTAPTATKTPASKSPSSSRRRTSSAEDRSTDGVS